MYRLNLFEPIATVRRQQNYPSPEVKVKIYLQILRVKDNIIDNGYLLLWLTIGFEKRGENELKLYHDSNNYWTENTRLDFSLYADTL